MTVEDSILKSTKKALGIEADINEYDVDIIMHINGVFSNLWQIGIGPANGYMIEDETALWSEYLLGDNRLNSVRQFTYFKVRLAFDPPQSPHGITAIERQIAEIEWRINVTREEDQWAEPLSSPSPT